MVHLVLSSTKGLPAVPYSNPTHPHVGNQGLRYFPYVGYLGLTPVKVEGVVRTKLDDDAKQLQAKSITISVRCYESRIGRVSVLHSNILVDYTQTLWLKPDGEDYGLIDDLEFPFRITIPANVAGFSTAVFVDYRCMWRVEAVLNHVPISGVGSRQVKHFELPLVRFDLPPHQPTPPNPSKPLLLHQTTKPRAPRIRYAINTPTTPIGPLDIVSIPVLLLPMDEGVSIRTATVMIERRIQLNETATLETPASPYPIPTSSNPTSPRASPSSSLSSSSYSPSTSYQERSSAKFNGETSVASDTSSNPTITPHSISTSSTSINSETPLLPPTHASPHFSSSSSSSSNVPSKIIVTPVTGAESSGHFSRDDQGVWSKNVTLQWPAAKSHSRWAIGETIQSELVSVRFFARVKISVSSPNGTESIELGEKELLIVSTNEAERQMAITKFNDLIYNQHAEKSGRSKSKSPRRTRRDPDHDVPPPPAPYKASGKFGECSSTGSVTGTANGQGSGGSGKVATPRRPHTSAGPRDNKAFDFAGAQARVRMAGGEYQERERTEAREVEDVFRRHTVDSSSNGKPAPVRPETSPSVSLSKRRSGVVGSLFASAPRISTALSGSSNGTSTSASGSGSGSVTRSTSSSVSSQGGDVGTEERMREWEEELAKIEMLSRQSSDMLGFAGKRKRSAGAPRV
ncbi:hypothetical protein D9615_001855 [Tricholomella constricta]|uniref:Uncharacterized protein n=1 Tax=Tricholomella constricta TaxID=117010 RepID=A0A8H5HNW9_9AGAR|nr:hypothetical protein D9615_001855 [Tricholomella constricta]